MTVSRKSESNLAHLVERPAALAGVRRTVVPHSPVPDGRQILVGVLDDLHLVEDVRGSEQHVHRVAHEALGVGRNLREYTVIS